ncbi:MAG TPA: hypothetical protein G4O18_04860 [Dehalococcoidia bacterium]|nr:hypothetical protein [Dehalococcoidia bacterium]
MVSETLTNQTKYIELFQKLRAIALAIAGYFLGKGGIHMSPLFWAITVALIASFVVTDNWVLQYIVRVKGKWRILVCTSVVIAACGVTFGTSSTIQTDQERLQIAITESRELASSIISFVAEREQSAPKATDTIWDSPDEWFQRSSDYRSTSENLFSNRYELDLLEIGEEFYRLNVISEETLSRFNWDVHLGYIVADRICEQLIQFNSISVR